MTGKEFINAVANGKKDVLQVFIDGMAHVGSDYCVIGGLAVNAYADPVVSLDLDIVVAVDHVEALCKALSQQFTIEYFLHSINLGSLDSDLRIQLRTDPRYQTFIDDALIKDVLGYKLKVASVKDVIHGKLWAYTDKARRKSKRQKDLADIARLIEAYPDLVEYLPDNIRDRLEE